VEHNSLFSIKKNARKNGAHDYVYLNQTDEFFVKKKRNKEEKRKKKKKKEKVDVGSIIDVNLPVSSRRREEKSFDSNRIT
jgi:hypothetical protein